MRVGNIYEKQGLAIQALGYYKKCIEIEPTNQTVAMKITELQTN